MYREIIYFCAELLNYWSMTFFGLKLFAKVYEFSVHKNKNVENVIYALLCLPIGIVGAINYLYVIYSTLMTYIPIVGMFVAIKIVRKKVPVVSIAFYIFMMRLLDLLIVSVITEVNKMSRNTYIEFIMRGEQRVLFMIILVSTYYLVMHFCLDSNFIKCLLYDKYYRGVMCLFSFLGNSCFNGVYHLRYDGVIMKYWIFYLICGGLLIGGFWFYINEIKGKERERFLNMRNDLMEANYLGLQKAYEENKTLQHDHKNHLLAVSELIKENKNEEALEYIKNYLIVGKRMMHEIQSRNDIIDIIVSSKISETLEKGIKFVYSIDNIGKLEMDNIDVCALLANLLDNAIESCEKIKENETKIDLRILKKNDTLIIQILNSVYPEISNKKHIFCTDKDNHQLHGWGMHSIEQVIKKYGGEKRHFIKDDMIEIFITIPL